MGITAVTGTGMGMEGVPEGLAVPVVVAGALGRALEALVAARAVRVAALASEAKAEALVLALAPPLRPM